MSLQFVVCLEGVQQSAKVICGFTGISNEWAQGGQYNTNLQVIINLVFIIRNSNQTCWSQDACVGFIAAYKYSSASKNPFFSYKIIMNHSYWWNIKKEIKMQWDYRMWLPLNEARETTIRDMFAATFLVSLLQISSANSFSKVLTKRMPPG